ncbi:MAG TPA: adenine phosphoribosyltransferase [Candidatus Binataceae bacterium]|nr:adenine phosphoribosyltransferase [Candidatus Binataceae bacterium]
MTSQQLHSLVRDIPDFPKPGIVFKDLTPLWADPRALAAIVDQLAEPFLGKVDSVVGIESRGFIMGAPVAYRLGVGLVIARKPGKLPYQCISQEYQLEYGTDKLEMHSDGIIAGRRILIVDDLLATGGTAKAAVGLVEQLHGEVIGCAFVIELNVLKGRELLAPIRCHSLLQYD